MSSQTPEYRTLENWITSEAIPFSMDHPDNMNAALDKMIASLGDSVELLGFSGISDIRQGKYFEIALDGSLDNTQARESVEKIAREVLSNPIIEDYRVEIES